MTEVKDAQTGKTDPKATAAIAKRRDAFLKLAPPRMSKALKALKQVERLTSRAYDWEASHGAQMVGALKASVKRIEDGLNRSAPAAADEGFTFGPGNGTAA